MAALGGIGFTVSLFIAQLAYTDPEIVGIAKVGILAGSLISGAVGAGLLLWQTTGGTHAPPSAVEKRATVQHGDPIGRAQARR